MDLEPVLEAAPKLIATHTAKLAYNYLASRVKERIERNWELMSKDMREKVTPDNPLRNDWFAENEVLNNHIPFRLLEKTIREITNDSEERKSPHIARFWVNICLTSNAHIDEATAFSYFEVIESLSWRQLCIIRLIVLYGDHEVEIHHISVEDVEQLPQDEQTSFYSIGRDYRELMDDHYIIGANVRTLNDNPFLSNPGSGQFPDDTCRLHSLMNLDDIPMPDIVQTFSPWKVRPRKSE